MSSQTRPFCHPAWSSFSFRHYTVSQAGIWAKEAISAEFSFFKIFHGSSFQQTSLTFNWPKLWHKGTWETENFSFPASDNLKHLIFHKCLYVNIRNSHTHWEQGRERTFCLKIQFICGRIRHERNRFVVLTFQMLQCCIIYIWQFMDFTKLIPLWGHRAIKNK